MAEDDSEKTEDPTGKKLSNAREEGQIPQSQEIKIWAGLMAALVMIAMLSPGLSRDVMRMMLPYIEHPHTIDMSREALGITLANQVMDLIWLLMMPMAVMLD